MKPLYRFYMNLGITAGLSALIYCMFYFLGACSAPLLFIIVPVGIMIYAYSN